MKYLKLSIQPSIYPSRPWNNCWIPGLTMTRKRQLVSLSWQQQAATLELRNQDKKGSRSEKRSGLRKQGGRWVGWTPGGVLAVSNCNAREAKIFFRLLLPLWVVSRWEDEPSGWEGRVREKWSKVVQNCPNGPKWSKIIIWICYREISERYFFWDTL